MYHMESGWRGKAHHVIVLSWNSCSQNNRLPQAEDRKHRNSKETSWQNGFPVQPQQCPFSPCCKLPHKGAKSHISPLQILFPTCCEVYLVFWEALLSPLVFTGAVNFLPRLIAPGFTLRTFQMWTQGTFHRSLKLKTQCDTRSREFSFFSILPQSEKSE